ncbi:MAG: FAD-binding protein [Chloroflexi bacterium]|jgi:fumarate reductase (CoM/CoB) subunit A|nr:FAD-binding protein [Chloroflexota bacterium]
MINANLSRIHETDVLVIGGGAAAARSAVAASASGASVTMVLKKQLGKSGATNYPGMNKHRVGSAWQAADGCGGADDSPEVHYNDIMLAAAGMADARMAKILAEESPERLLELEGWGFELIDDPEGKRPHYSGYSCFASQPRAHGMVSNSTGGHTGTMVESLAAQANRHGTQVHEGVTVVDLIVEGGECTGAVAMNDDGELLIYRAAAVIMATGGAAQMFPLSHAPGDITGDGYAIAYRAGAELVNIEFMQYMVREVKGVAPMGGGPWWTLNPVLRNRKGEEFLQKYLPAGVTAEDAFEQRTHHYPYSTADISKWVDIAIQCEIRSGNGNERNAISVDFSGVDVTKAKPARPQHHPSVDGIELGDEVIDIAHSAHAINGGIRVDEYGESTVAGLFAVGETIAGPHGADRLGGGMLAACNVFGKRAGEKAAERARSVGSREFNESALEPVMNRINRFGNGSGESSWFDVRKSLKTTAGNSLIAVRSATLLEQMRENCSSLRYGQLLDASVENRQDLLRVLETDNLVFTADLMALTALHRTESRGSHYREDHPERSDENWDKSIFWKLGADGEPEPTSGKYRQDPNESVQVSPA